MTDATLLIYSSDNKDDDPVEYTTSDHVMYIVLYTIGIKPAKISLDPDSQAVFSYSAVKPSLIRSILISSDQTPSVKISKLYEAQKSWELLLKHVKSVRSKIKKNAR